MSEWIKASRTYNWVDKDPVCDEIATLVKDAGLSGKKNVGKIAILATLAHGTVDALLYGATRKPTNNTIMSIATALGFERTWQLSKRGENFDLEKELAEARAFIKKQKALREKWKEKNRPKKKGGKRKSPKRKRGSHLRLVA